ncbi:hypothetical protein HanIR_Chr02g0069161 [Helianthus annuus]|nr:hypothetical protein HanIR_Chr02g0069161 [Helianthus annuus]
MPDATEDEHAVVKQKGILKVEKSAQKEKSIPKRKDATKCVDVERRTSKHEETTKGSNKEVVSPKVKKTVSKKVMRVSNWQSIRTRISPHQLLVGLNTFSKQQLVAIKNMGFGSIMKLKTDSLPAKMSHFVVDNFSGKDMAIKLTVGNIEVNETVISELLGLRNSGAVIEYKKKEKKKDKENEEQKEHKDEQKGKIMIKTVGLI